MTTKVDPLTWNTPIVNPNGTPTSDFMRKWQQQGTANATIPALSGVFVNTTAPLTGGGSLGSGVLTLALSWTLALVSALLDNIGATRGSILYRGASGWAILTPGAAGTVLTSQGAGADPHWV